MERRELLKLMAALPVLAAAGCKMVSTKTTDSTLSMKAMNVIFEGPMIFMMEDPQVRVLAPRVSGHQYLVNGQSAAETTFLLKGVSGTDSVANTRYELPAGADAFRLSASQLGLTLDSGKSPFFTFMLPAPNRVVALQSRPAQVVDAFGNTRSAVMPTTYAFVYNLSAADFPVLDPASGWSAQQQAVEGGFTNLDVAAGLPLNVQDPGGHHAHAAFSELTSFFPGLGLQILSTGAQVQSGEVDGLPQAFRRAGLDRQPDEYMSARVMEATLRSHDSRPRILSVSATIDCTAGGVIVTKP